MNEPTLMTPLLLWKLFYGTETMNEKQIQELEEFEKYTKVKR